MGWDERTWSKRFFYSYTSIFQPRNSKVSLLCAPLTLLTEQFLKKQMALGERMLFGVGVVWNILKSAVSISFAVSNWDTWSPPLSERMQFHTLRCFICLDCNIFFLMNDLICACFFFQTHFFFWHIALHDLIPAYFWLCFPISCHSKLQSSYDEGFVISQPLLPIQASCPMLNRVLICGIVFIIWSAASS